jgi:16S rRNA (uracil1498-N3)-methyltransferase
MQIFYNSKIKGNDKTFLFDKNESRHIIKVLRKKIYDKIFISNGLGCIFEAEINSENQNKCEVSILNVCVEKPKDFKIHLAVAPTKLNDRFEWFIEKATEIGVDIITPIFCMNSERKIIKEGRFQKILESAAKQSLRAHFPVLKKAISFKKFIALTPMENCFIAHCYEGTKKPLKELAQYNKNTVVMIGPEGDFSLEEIQIAQNAGFISVSLGKARLRTETAAIVACHTLQLYNE